MVKLIKSTVEDYSERYPSFDRDSSTQVDRCIGEVIAKYNGIGPAALARFFEAVHQRLAPLARDLERQNTKLQEQLATMEETVEGCSRPTSILASELVVGSFRVNKSKLDAFRQSMLDVGGELIT